MMAFDKTRNTFIGSLFDLITAFLDRGFISLETLGIELFNHTLQVLDCDDDEIEEPV